MVEESDKHQAGETPASPAREHVPDEPVAWPAAGLPVPVQRGALAGPIAINGKGLDVDRTEVVSGSKPSPGIALAYLAGIAAAEVVVALVDPLAGIVLHILLLLGLVAHSALTAGHPQHKLYLAIALAPLIRVLSLSLPLAHLPEIYWYAIIAVPLVIAVFVVKKRLGYSRQDVGLTVGNLPLQLLVGATGIPFGILEFYLLRPEGLVDNLTWSSLALPALILLVATGFVEEICFRGVMQRSAEESIPRWGLVYVAGLFAALHIGHLVLPSLVFVFAVGLFFGGVVRRTGSLLGVTLSHGLINIVLFLVAPLLLG